jgi:peptide/nickel transport system substrate-binding protein
VPASRPERIEVTIGRAASHLAQDIERDRVDYMFDPVPSDARRSARARAPGQYEEHVTNSTYYFWLNNELPPFDDVHVRRAVHRGLDKLALARLYGGLLQVTCNFFPPGVPGYEALRPCPFGKTRGHPVAARAAIRKHGADGARVVVWGLSQEPSSAVVLAFVDQLRDLGFDASANIVSPSVYFQVIGNAKTPDLNAGFANWFQYFPHPSSFAAAVRGDLIRPRGNYNFSRTNHPALTRAIKRLQARPLNEATRRRWAAIDRRIVNDAGVIPYGHLRATVYVSDRVELENCPVWHPVYVVDYTRFCLD